MTIITKTLVIASLVATPIAAKCGPHEIFVKLLSEKYNEYPVAVGLVGSTRVMETFASAEGTWTVAVTNAEGITCILAAGDNYEGVPKDARLTGTPS